MGKFAKKLLAALRAVMVAETKQGLVVRLPPDRDIEVVFMLPGGKVIVLGYAVEEPASLHLFLPEVALVATYRHEGQHIDATTRSARPVRSLWVRLDPDWLVPSSADKAPG